jgi:hypothetical protein
VAAGLSVYLRNLQLICRQARGVMEYTRGESRDATVRPDRLIAKEPRAEH